MLSTKHATLAAKILSLALVAAISIFFLSSWVPRTAFVKDSIESVEKNKNTVMALSAATMATSLAISAFPDDFGSSLANNLANMNTFFIGLFAILLLEKTLAVHGVRLAFSLLIPWACAAGAIGIGIKKPALKNFALRLCAVALAVAFVVPCSTYLANYVAADMTAYVEETIAETEGVANKLNTAAEDDSGDRTIFEKLSDLFQTAMKGVSDFLQFFRNTIRRCMNAISILILTNFIVPLLTFFALKWILKETFNIVLPQPALKRVRQLEDEDDDDDDEMRIALPKFSLKRHPKIESKAESKCIAAGEKSHEE